MTNLQSERSSHGLLAGRDLRFGYGVKYLTYELCMNKGYKSHKPSKYVYPLNSL